MARAMTGLSPTAPMGRVTGATGGTVQISGLGQHARLGDRVVLRGIGESWQAEVIRVERDTIHLMPDGSADGIALGNIAVLAPSRPFAPDASWIGRVIDPDGLPLDGRALLPGVIPRRLRAAPPEPQSRRPLGARLQTDLAIFDTLLPIVRGQRIGLFAGSGVGKSTLLGDFAKGVEADVIVVGLVGERGREVREFVEETLGPDGVARSVIVVATSDRAPQTRRRCAWSATAVAEHFRDEGKQVLLLLDSVTRFAEAHREVATAAGEAAALRGYPATTGPSIASLCERAGPGGPGTGDITAIYTVLVAGSDMEEPVADMLRGVLDGHVVLDRAIAERGRFPAVDLLRSVSRSLPRAASADENTIIAQTRTLAGHYDRAEIMIQAGLYVAGSDPATDAAVACHDALEHFFSIRNSGSVEASFTLLKKALAAAQTRI